MGCGSAIKGKKLVITCYNMDEPPKQAKGVRPDTKGHMLYDSIYMNCPEQANLARQKAEEWLLGLRWWDTCTFLYTVKVLNGTLKIGGFYGK